MLDVHADPLREVRVFKGWVSLVAVLALLSLAPVYLLLLRLTPIQTFFIFLLSLTLLTLAMEFGSRYGYRLRKRIAYPNLLGFILATIHDFQEACEVSVHLAARWLKAEAAVIAWLDDDSQDLVPVAASGLASRWIDARPRMSMGHRSLREAVQQGQPIFKPSTAADPWFASLDRRHHVVYVPLVSHDRAIGVLGLAGDSAELGDRRLLIGLGMVMAIALDNCRLYHAEHERAQRMQQLARMKSDFLITVSHELRTPLTSIKTAAEMLLEEEEQEKAETPRLRLIRNIVRGASRLSSLVADLVDMSQQERLATRLDLEPVAVGEVVSNAVSLIYPLLSNKNQTLDCQLPSPSPLIMVDRRRFEQVLLNLLSNAHRFSPSNSQIRIGLRQDEGEVIIAVSDSGPGVPEAERELIFEPFYHGDRAGLGLGLAIAKSIAELHGGRIWVESEGPGSTFCVAVPRVREPALVSSQAAADS